jgi:hypothetical protein
VVFFAHSSPENVKNHCFADFFSEVSENCHKSQKNTRSHVGTFAAKRVRCRLCDFFKIYSLETRRGKVSRAVMNEQGVETFWKN